MKKLMVLLVLVLMAPVFGITQAVAHEFIVKPVQMQVSVGQKVPFSVISAHVFMVSEEMEPLDQVDLSLVKANEIQKLTLKPNDMLLTHDGIADLKQEGTHILAGHRKGMIWTHTTQGWQQASKKGLQGVLSSGKYEKFCKTLVVAGQSDEGYKKILGHQLEIVPLGDPKQAVIGKDLRFQILFDGKPLSTEVHATYDGFTDAPNTYAYFTEADENGVARVKITHPGTWMVRVQHKLTEPTEDYDQHVLRSVLVFGVN